MKKVRDNIYQLPVPLPNSPLVATTDHLILGQPGERHLLIDTAFDLPSCQEHLLSQLAQFDLDFSQLDVFITHLHADHAGLMPLFKNQHNQIFMSGLDYELLLNGSRPEGVQQMVRSNDSLGIPPERRLRGRPFAKKNPTDRYNIPITRVKPGEKLYYGGYELEVVDLAGHTPAQVGLFARQEKFMFVGDHILNRVTPNISTWDLETDYLQVYLDNLAKFATIDVEVLYTGHFQAVTAPQQRAAEIIQHHHERLAQILALVTAAKQTAFELATQMRWLGGQHILDLGPQQVWFASTEVMAHLQNLAAHGKIKAEIVAGTVYYTR